MTDKVCLYPKISVEEHKPAETSPCLWYIPRKARSSVHFQNTQLHRPNQLLTRPHLFPCSLRSLPIILEQNTLSPVLGGLQRFG